MSISLTPIAIDFQEVSAALGSGDKPLLEQLLVKYRDELVEIDELADELEEDEDDSDTEDDEDSAPTNLRALSQALEQAKLALQKGHSVDDMMKGLEQAKDVSAQQKKALQDFLDDTDDEDDVDDDEQFASAADVLRHLITGEKPALRVTHKFKYGCALLCLCHHLGEMLPRSDEWLELRGSSWKRTLDKALKDIGIPTKTLSISKQLASRGSPFTAIPKYSGSPEIGYLKRSEIETALAALPSAAVEKVGTQERKFLADIRDWLQACSNAKRDLICFTR